MPHLLSISTSEASTAEQLAAKRDNEFIIALPEVEPHHNPIHNHNHNHNPNHHPNHNPNPDPDPNPHQVEPHHKLQKTSLERRTLVMHRKPTPLPLSFDGEDHVALAAGDLDALYDVLGGDNLRGDGRCASTKHEPGLPKAAVPPCVPPTQH